MSFHLKWIKTKRALIKKLFLVEKRCCLTLNWLFLLKFVLFCVKKLFLYLTVFFFVDTALATMNNIIIYTTIIYFYFNMTYLYDFQFNMNYFYILICVIIRTSFLWIWILLCPLTYTIACYEADFLSFCSPARSIVLHKLATLPGHVLLCCYCLPTFNQNWGLPRAVVTRMSHYGSWQRRAFCGGPRISTSYHFSRIDNWRRNWTSWWFKWRTFSVSTNSNVQVHVWNEVHLYVIFFLKVVLFVYHI